MVWGGDGAPDVVVMIVVVGGGVGHSGSLARVGGTGGECY